MGSQGKESLPIIDFSSQELNPGTPLWDTVKSQVRKAAEDYGCFLVVFKNIPQQLRNATNKAMEDIFALPLETKKLNVSEVPFHGYIGPSDPTSIYESLGFDNSDYDHVEHFTNVLWPQGNKNLSETLYVFIKELTELDQTIRRMIVESLGIEKLLDEHLNSTYNHIRLSKYEAPKTTEKKIGIKSHTDKNTTTIIYQNQIGGLQVQLKNGDWINVEFSPDSVIYLIGDSLHAWTSGRLHSVPHRVMMSGNETRYSAVIFTIPNDDYTIKAVEELVDEEHPALYKPYKYIEYLKRRQVEAAKDFEFPLKDFFGV